MSDTPDPSSPSLPRAERRRRLAAAQLYLVCDALPGGYHRLEDFLPSVIAGGVEIVQLREKEYDGHYNWRDRYDRRYLREAAGHAADLCAEHGALFIVNDYPEAAVDVGADGVHVGQDDMPVAQARAIVGPDMLVGLSTHTPGEIDVVDPNVVDYIGVGPIHATPTKPGRPPVGLELVRYAAAHAPVPFFAIGGLYVDNVGEVLDAGATRVCVLRALAAADDPGQAARELRAAIHGRTREAE